MCGYNGQKQPSTLSFAKKKKCLEFKLIYAGRQKEGNNWKEEKMGDVRLVLTLTLDHFKDKKKNLNKSIMHFS